MKVEIIGLDKAEVLLALYNNAKFGGEGFGAQARILSIMAEMASLGDPERAEAIINEAIARHSYYFDYIDLGSGPRPLKVDLSGFDFDSTQYDKNHGRPGYAAQIINALRSQYVAQSSNESEDSMGYLLSQWGLMQQNRNNLHVENDYDSDNSSTLSNG